MNWQQPEVLRVLVWPTAKRDRIKKKLRGSK